MDDTKLIMQSAQEAMQQDRTRRQYVDMAVNEAMRHVEHIDSEVDKRDLYNVAVVAAMGAIELAFTRTPALAAMQEERDHYKKLAEDGFMLRPASMIITDKPAI